MPHSPEQLLRKAAIAANLVRIETEKPGSIRLAPNSCYLRAAVDMLADAGFRKPFLARSRQFVIDTFLTYERACELLLGDCLLVGPHDNEFRYPLWSAVGGFRAWLRPLPQVRPDDRLLFVINIAPVIFESIGEGRYFFNLLDLDESGIELLRGLNARKPANSAAREAAPDGSSFELAIVLKGAMPGLAAFVEQEYLNDHYPGYQMQRQAIKKHAGKSFDVVDFTTADGESKTIYFFLSDITHI